MIRNYLHSITDCYVKYLSVTVGDKKMPKNAEIYSEPFYASKKECKKGSKKFQIFFIIILLSIIVPK